MTAFAELEARIGAINDLLCSASVLTWDSRTMMPSGGAAARGRQIATLKGLAREMLVDDATLRLCERAAAEAKQLPEQAPERRAVGDIAAAIDHHRRIPAGLLAEQHALAPVAGAAWAEARARSDFSLFLPFLTKTVELSRRLADAIGYQGHPYDAMVGIFEPGETAATVSALFGELRAGIAPILATARERPAPRRDFLFRDFPVENQRAAAAELAELIGYDMSRGRIDRAVHPFEVSFTRADVRITTRYYERFLSPSIFGTMHEVGHARYEQGVDPSHTRTVFATDLISLYAVGGTSFGAHESQSRLWENHVGRSSTFWRKNFERLQRHFPTSLGDVEADEFTAAVNHVEPGFIRVEADELTYDLHIMLRFDIEKALMDGSLAPADLPEAWNAAVKRDFGIEVPNDAQGCLQDTHWSSGYVGSFPTYTIGNVMAAQIMERLRLDAELAARIDEGDYFALAERLERHIWRHGRSRTRDELLVELTGQPLEPGAYLTYLRHKFA